MEWAQAMLMLVMLGAQYLDEAGMVAVLEAGTAVQRRRWS